MQAVQQAPDEFRRLEQVAHSRGGVWVASLIELAGMFVFVAIFNFILPNLGSNLSGAGLILLGLLFSLVPAALWLVFFYRMDRIEPEPKRMVLSIFVLGAVVTAALHTPLLTGLFDVNNWLYNSWWTRLAGGILIVGVIEQYLIYLTIRFGIVDNAEFNERIDGVIYGVAAGLGMATVLNFIYVIQHGGVDLDIGSIRMVVNALAYGSLGGLQGYFIGQARFEQVPFYYLPKGLAIAASVNGLFFFLLDRTAGSGMTYNPWSDLFLAAMVAVVTLGVLFWLIGRANEETLRLAHEAVRSGELTAAGVPAEALQAVESSRPAADGSDAADEKEETQ